MDLNQIVPLIRDLGITGATVLILLLRLEPRLERMAASNDRLTAAILSLLVALGHADVAKQIMEDKT